MNITEIRSAVFVLNSYINRFDSKILSKLDLTVAQAKVIFFLATSGRDEIYQKDVDACLGMTHSTMSDILKRMEQKGLLFFYPSPHDARKKVLNLTEKSVCLFREMGKEFNQKKTVLVGDIPAAEMEIFEAVLMKMISNLKPGLSE